jgi:hypothetical protein
MLDAACAFLAERFELDRLYDEAEVNAMLAEDAPDPATLRRLLVDHGFLGRRNGAYWRERPHPPPAPAWDTGPGPQHTGS